MIQRLYINGELVDISEDTKITLNYKSNIFGDVSKITASNSLTINLPKTTRNRRIFNNPTAPAYNSQFRYSRHTCRYEQDGIELLNGYAVLLSSADTYEIALYWGVLTAYQAWVDADPSLRDIGGNSSVQWDSTATPITYASFLSSGYGFADYAMQGEMNGREVGVQKSLRNIHPSVSVRWILTKMELAHNVQFIFPKRVADEVRHLTLPCLTMNAGENYWRDAKLTATADMYVGTNAVQLRALDVVAPDHITVEDRTISAFDGYRTYFTTANADKVRFTFKDFRANSYSAISEFNVVAKSEDGSTLATYTFNTTTNASGVVGFDLSEEINVEDMDEVYFFIKSTRASSGISWSAESFTYTPLVAENAYPCAYDIVPNLPDISQIVLIKALCAMFGLFAMPDPTNANGILFIGIEDLLDNRANAYDWSDNLLGERGGDTPEAQFSISEWAQENWFKYAEDDSVKGNANASLKVSNETLERERDAVELPFAPSDGNRILQYDINIDDSGLQSVELRDVKPRIMRLFESESGNASLRFNGLRFSELLNTYYKGYSQLLNSCVVIKEKLRLTEYDIRDLDFTRPVYLAQYGRYFGIVSLQVSGKECTAELARLPIN